MQPWLPARIQAWVWEGLGLGGDKLEDNWGPWATVTGSGPWPTCQCGPGPGEEQGAPDYPRARHCDSGRLSNGLKDLEQQT